MKFIKLGSAALAIALICAACGPKDNVPRMSDTMMIRMAEIKINQDFLQEYIAILKEEAEASVRLEPGVIAIFPMFGKAAPTEIRILEIYASKEAYESHLQTPHFKKYKTSTVHMVESLKLLDMESLDKGTMPQLFLKMSH